MTDADQWSDEIEERIDKLEGQTAGLDTKFKLISGGVVFLGIGVAVLGITSLKIVKGFNQLVPAVNGLVELANAAQQAVIAQAPMPMPPGPYNPDGGNLPVKHFNDGTPTAPVQEGWDPGEQEAPEHVQAELTGMGFSLEDLFDEQVGGGEPLPSNENLPEP